MSVVHSEFVKQTLNVFAEGGELSQAVEGYIGRPVQTQMAAEVAKAIEEAGTAIIEAGTGTGKTYAYLIPALLSNTRVVISTGTRNLQDQLFHRDIPQVLKALNIPAQVALLKGRANYGCHERIGKAIAAATANEIEQLMLVRDWLSKTRTGEVSELPFVQGNHTLAAKITSTAENCLGSKCPSFDECFVASARRKAVAAEVVVVNHHLLFADFMLKQEGFGQILPGADVVIVDEAHQLPELGYRFFGSRLSTRQLRDCVRDVYREIRELTDVSDRLELVQEFSRTVADTENMFLSVENRMSAAQFLTPQKREIVQRLSEGLDQLAATLADLADRAQAIANLAERFRDCRQRLNRFLDYQDAEFVCWVESLGQGGGFNATPVTIDRQYPEMVAGHAGAWIYTSATLATVNSFTPFSDSLGLKNSTDTRLESPFNFAEQARLYLPKNLPNPNTPEYMQAFFDEVKAVIDGSGGGAFVLCTSNRAVKALGDKLRAYTRFKVFVQGEEGRAELLDAFAQHGNAVLVGTSSFWEGVDVRGQALRVVAIDRLPFVAPGDPVFEARCNALEQQGKRPFTEMQLPAMIAALRQGAGRLIRDVADRGVLMIGDPRLTEKSYGRAVLRALPPMPMVRDQSDILEFLETVPRV